MEQESEGKLVTTKLENTLGAASVPIALEPPHEDGVVHFGDTVMINSPLEGVLAANPSTGLPLTQEAYQVTRAAAIPSARTRWMVCSTQAEGPADGILRFGMEFMLVAEVHGKRFYLQG